MKKIFAIALALVMVLSMASAFATYCNWGAWECDSEATIKCGKATVEVVPYVRSATACGSEFVANDCAAAIVGENVYFAVKLTVDADINKDWWDAMTLTIKGTDVDGTLDETVNSRPAWKDVKNGGVFYLYKANATDATDVASCTGWEKEDEDFTFGAKNVFAEKVAKSSAKVCATLKSQMIIGTPTQKTDGEATHLWKDQEFTVGKYSIALRGDKYTDTDAEYIVVEWGNKEAYIYLDKDNKVDYVWVDADDTTGGNVKLVGYTNLSATAYEAADGTEYGFTCGEGAVLKEVFDFLKMDFDTCVTYAGVSNNFGWNDKVVSCTSYKKAGMAIVDAECVVAIPKTGDASVLAWLF